MLRCKTESTVDHIVNETTSLVSHSESRNRSVLATGRVRLLSRSLRLFPSLTKSPSITSSLIFPSRLRLVASATPSTNPRALTIFSEMVGWIGLSVNASVLSNWDNCAWPNCSSLKSRISLARNSSQFGDADALHLRKIRLVSSASNPQFIWS